MKQNVVFLSSPCVDVFGDGLIVMEINCSCQVPQGLRGGVGQYRQSYLMYCYCYCCCNIQELLLLISFCVRLEACLWLFSIFCLDLNKGSQCVVFLTLV